MRNLETCGEMTNMRVPLHYRHPWLFWFGCVATALPVALIVYGFGYNLAANIVALVVGVAFIVTGLLVRRGWRHPTLGFILLFFGCVLSLIAVFNIITNWG